MTLSREEIVAALPANLKNSLTDQNIDHINNTITDPEVAEYVRNNFISYTGILKDGKFKTEDYINAVIYVSYKLMGDTNKEAWCKTFPSRHASLVARGADSSQIAAHVTAYNKGKLVNLILEQSIVPTWVLNADIHQKAINVLADLMVNASSEKVQSDSANALLTHLKKPEGKAELSIDLKDSSGMNELKAALTDMAATQRALIEGGVGIKKITASKIIEADTQ